MNRLRNTLMYLYIYFWATIEILLKIKHEGKFYLVLSRNSKGFPTLQLKLTETFVKEKRQHIQTLSKTLPQEAFIREAMKESLSTFRFLVFLVPSKSTQFVQFLISYKDRGNLFMLDINARRNAQGVIRLQKASSVLRRLHFYPHTQDKDKLKQYANQPFTGFYHRVSEPNVDCLQVYFKRSQVAQAAFLASSLIRTVFNYDGKMRVIIGDTQDQYIEKNRENSAL